MPPFPAVSNSSCIFLGTSFEVCLFNPSSFPYTCEIPPLLFLRLSLQKMLHSNSPISFTNAVGNPSRAIAFSDGWEFGTPSDFFKSQFLGHAAQIHRVGRERW